MESITLTLPVTALLASTAGALVWVVRVLWKLDRRVIVCENKLGIKGESPL